MTLWDSRLACRAFPQLRRRGGGCARLPISCWNQPWYTSQIKTPRKRPKEEETMSETAAKVSRRKFLKTGALAAGAATMAAPSVVKAQGPINMRWQSTWPSKDIFHEYAIDFAKKVNDMTGGDLKIEVLPAGAVVPAFGLLDAVSKGTLDGGHGVLVYHYGKQTALALWGSGPGYGMDANMLLSWHKYGGGKQLLQKLYASIGANVMSFPYGPMFTQPLGWYKKPITKTKFDGLPDKMKAIIESAVEAASADMAWKSIDRYSKDYIELQTKDKVRFYRTPDSVLQKQLEIYDQVVDKKSTDNPMFKEIVESQKAFAARAVKWDLDTNVSRRMAYNHYFGAKSAPAQKKS